MWYNLPRMKKGFTLVELLIVVVVLVTLMSMTFRLSSIGSNQSNRNKTVSRLQKLENCLSGYYAAFGTYPPVRLHGSRNYRLKVSAHGIQNVDGDEQDPKWSWFNAESHSVTSSRDEAEDWEMVQAACKAQPVDCKYPFPQDDRHWQDLATAVSEELSQRVKNDSSVSEDQKNKFDNLTIDVHGVLNAYGDKSEWREVQIFQFGLMSFLLPRYLVMMDSGSSNGGGENIYKYPQWSENNALPCDPMTGQTFADWPAVQKYANSEKPKDLARVANIPSQSVCARWLPNLEGECACSHSFNLFGVDIRDASSSSSGGIPLSTDLEVFTPGGYQQGSGGQSYLLDGVTVRDGWNNPFYYYSPAPYQTYVLWSAGPNGRTFPPWVSRESLNADANACVGYWTEDDVVNMSH